MSKPKRFNKPPSQSPTSPQTSRASRGEPSRPASAPTKANVSLRRGDDGTWELVPPRCALVRREDLEEVEQMIAAGEHEIARDELRWLLADCHDFIAAHKLLGDLALIENDLPLARGHFGYAYQLGVKAIDSAGRVGPVPYAKPANRAFFDAGKSLANCLMKLDKAKLARDVAGRLLQLDLTDPLKLRQIGGKPDNARSRRRR